jgi:hypothetical protein
MPRFVVLEHDSPRGLHWDLMLQQDQLLATWALAQPPDADGPVAAERLFNHRLVYLDYEGPVSDGRGNVTSWDQGTYEVRSRSEHVWTVLLAGRRLIGEATLRRMPGEETAWEFTFHPIV